MQEKKAAYAYVGKKSNVCTSKKKLRLENVEVLGSNPGPMHV
jgi:hypothetical protein